MKWEDLSFKDRANLISIGVDNGIHDIDSIKKAYNRFADGGGISDQQYGETMEKVAHDNWKMWGDKSEDLALLRALNDNTYNYRAYYNKYPNGNGNALDHWTDEFKTAYHPTFSDESVYSGKVSQYNPTGRLGGHWANNIEFQWKDPKLIHGNLFFNGGGETNITLPDGAYKMMSKRERGEVYARGLSVSSTVYDGMTDEEKTIYNEKINAYLTLKAARDAESKKKL